MSGQPVTMPSAESLAALAALRERQLRAVLQISEATHSKTNLDDLIRDCLQVALDTADASAGSVILYDPKKEKLVFTYVIGSAAPMLTGLELAPDQGICGQVFQTGQPLITDDPTKEQRHLTSVGEQVHYVTKNMVSVPLRSSDGAAIGVMQVLNKKATNFDQHDLEVLTILGAQAASAIESARLHEEAKKAVVVNLMGDISHDIKNLITPVTTCTQTLEMLFDGMFEDVDRILGENRDQVPEMVEQLEQAWEFLRSFYKEAVEMILEGSTATQDRVREIADCVKGIVSEPHFEPTVVNEIVERVRKPLKVVADKNGVTLVTDDPGDVPPTLIDQKQLYNAIYNLINNGIPETPAGGSISVKTYAKLDGEFPEGSYVAIDVADTGKGMPPEVKQRLFTENAISTKPGGTGLGTRIVKNAVDAHGGVITVESEQGKGTTFFMKLPLRSEPEPEGNGGNDGS